MRLNEERYLGDAVYVSLDSFGQVRLRCAAPACEIYLDQEVQSALLDFIRDVRVAFYGGKGFDNA